MSVGIRCLLENDPVRALSLAAQLDDFNRDRRAIEANMQVEAERILQHMTTRERLGFSICLFDETWHQGVIGILASRIKERYNRPCLIFAPGDEGQLKASGRSISGLHLRDALDEVATRHPHVLQKFGGHAMAAGLTIAQEHYAEFCEAFESVVAKHLTEVDLDAVIETDGELNEGDFLLETAMQLRDAGPWGQGFPEPKFDGEFILIQQRLLSGKHLKCVLSPINHPHIFLDGIAFNIDATVWPAPENSRVRLAYSLDVNHFRGVDNLQLMIDYLELVP
jgi:single-stranded-DNA-specific exonuclease